MGKIIMHIFVISIMCLLIFWLKTLSFIRVYGNVIVNNLLANQWYEGFNKGPAT